MSSTTTEAGTGLRERKKLATRRRIKDEALSLALERGLDRLTVEAIAAAADVSPRTFFNYFACKEEALIGDGGETAAAMLETIRARPAHETPLQTLHAAITQSTMLTAAHLDRDRARARQQLVRDNPSLLPRQLAQYATVERTFIEAMAERLGADPDVDLRPALLAAIAVSVIRVATQRWTADGNAPLLDLVDEAFALLPQDLTTHGTRKRTHG
ncbi:MAG TPA: TetR family transcriptional regulator [Nocardioidaceae bacterium]|nr:TetR family transcriptional regulator [Nocardioidaceae bacterium]